MPQHSPFQLDRTVTHRLHTLSKLTDRQTQQAYLAEVGIPLGEGRCLAAVASFGPLSVNDLAAYANLDKGQASRAAQSLVEQDLIRKTAVPTDARGVLLALAPEGRKLWTRLRAVIARRNAEITACLSAEEHRMLDTLLERLVAHARTQPPADPRGRPG